MTGGGYFDLPDVDPWDIERDAMLYGGPHPVVAHPPCAAWCRLAGFREHVHGLKRGEDGGTFEAALTAVQRWGGVLEHPAYSDAWIEYGLPLPSAGGWQRGICGGWACEVAQSAYGHKVQKRTWLYWVGDGLPPQMDWSQPVAEQCPPSRMGLWRGMVGKKEALATPPAFREALLDLARASRGHSPA